MAQYKVNSKRAVVLGFCRCETVAPFVVLTFVAGYAPGCVRRRINACTRCASRAAAIMVALCRRVEAMERGMDAPWTRVSSVRGVFRGC